MKDIKFKREDYDDLKEKLIESILEFTEFYFIPDNFTDMESVGFEPVKRVTLEKTSMTTLFALFTFLLEKLATEYGYTIDRDYKRLLRI